MTTDNDRAEREALLARIRKLEAEKEAMRAEFVRILNWVDGFGDVFKKLRQQASGVLL